MNMSYTPERGNFYMTFRGKPLVDALLDKYVIELDFDTETQIISLILYDVREVTKNNYGICTLNYLRKANKDIRLAVRDSLEVLQTRLKNLYGIQLEHPKENYKWLEENIIDLVTELNFKRYVRRC